ncbi:MAG: hypothetical protein WBP93_12960 [Pyrinomonadaceae bacterium]
MIERLTTIETVENAHQRISELIAAHGEWFCNEDTAGKSISLCRDEMDVRVEHGRLIFSCWSREGARVWRVVGWEWIDGRLLLEATRRMGSERAMLSLVPRANASAITSTVSTARRARCQMIARLACALVTGAKVERAALSASTRRNQPGRYARILLRSKGERIAVTGSVVSGAREETDAMLSSALTWFTRLNERLRPPFIRKLWLVVAPQDVEATAQRLALLRDDLRSIIKLFAIDDRFQELAPRKCPELKEFWLKLPARIRRSSSVSMSKCAARIVSCAPDAIDVVRARQGETLRYHGLPFARVRRLMGQEHVWFGIESARRRLLDEETIEEFEKLLRELAEHRRADATDHAHALYRLAPEAWLESLLRRDITRLDPGLRVAPLHAQFRATQTNKAIARPVDLLALRHDGRLVVIELKVAEDREHVLQGARYWLEVEAHRRAGNIAHARLFGDALIADEPTLVYLVAPMLRFHRAFQTLARSITPEIEIYRFDLNEDWRAGGRAVRRCDLTH